MKGRDKVRLEALKETLASILISYDEENVRSTLSEYEVNTLNSLLALANGKNFPLSLSQFVARVRHWIDACKPGFFSYKSDFYKHLAQFRDGEKLLGTVEQAQALELEVSMELKTNAIQAPQQTDSGDATLKAQVEDLQRRMTEMASEQQQALQQLNEKERQLRERENNIASQEQQMVVWQRNHELATQATGEIAKLQALAVQLKLEKDLAVSQQVAAERELKNTKTAMQEQALTPEQLVDVVGQKLDKAPGITPNRRKAIMELYYIICTLSKGSSSARQAQGALLRPLLTILVLSYKTPLSTLIDNFKVKEEKHLNAAVLSMIDGNIKILADSPDTATQIFASASYLHSIKSEQVVTKTYEAILAAHLSYTEFFGFNEEIIRMLKDKPTELYLQYNAQQNSSAAAPAVTASLTMGMVVTP